MAEPQQKRIGAGGIIVLVIAGLWLYGSLKGDDGGGGNGSDEPAAPLVSRSAVRVIRADSFCSPEPSQARIRFVVWISNRGSINAEVDVLPIRYHSDGSDNRSILDLVTATISAGRRQFIDQKFSYNALEHDLVRCSVKLGVESGPLSAEIPIRLS